MFPLQYFPTPPGAVLPFQHFLTLDSRWFLALFDAAQRLLVILDS
jgi:hypothetical protein